MFEAARRREAEPLIEQSCMAPRSMRCSPGPSFHVCAGRSRDSPNSLMSECIVLTKPTQGAIGESRST